MISGVAVTVSTPAYSAGVDDMGDAIAGTPTQAQVENVLFDPTATSDLTDSLRASGERIDVAFHFPKTFTGSLRGCSIIYGGHSYEVVGDIRRYTESNVPGPWNGVVACKEVLG